MNYDRRNERGFPSLADPGNYGKGVMEYPIPDVRIASTGGRGRFSRRRNHLSRNGMTSWANRRRGGSTLLTRAKENVSSNATVISAPVRL